MAILASKAALAAASNRAKGMVAEAEAEMKAVDSLAEKRRFELEWKRLEVSVLICIFFLFFGFSPVPLRKRTHHMIHAKTQFSV